MTDSFLPCLQYPKISCHSFTIWQDESVPRKTIGILSKKQPLEESGVPKDKLPSPDYTNYTGSLQDKNTLRDLTSLRTYIQLE